MFLIPYLYFSIFILSLIVFFDILIKFKRPYFLKIILLLIVISVGNISLFVTFLPKINIPGVVFTILKAILACSFLQLFSVLYFPKTRLFINTISFIFMLFSSASYLYFIYFIPNYNEDNQLKTLVFGDEGFKVPIFFKVIRQLLFVIFFTTWIYFFYNIIVKFKFSNVYFDKIKSWSINFFILSIFVLLSNAASFYFVSIPYLSSYFSILIFFYILLIIMYRPAFINKSAIKIKFGEYFTKDNNFLISDSNFETEFYSKMYFLNKEASMEHLAKVLNVGTNDLYKFIYNKYSVSFNDLVNKNRVNYFLEIIKQPKFQNYSVDALAQEAGFTSRQHLYKPFKKFHGGNPSDLIEANVH